VGGRVEGKYAMWVYVEGESMPRNKDGLDRLFCPSHPNPCLFTFLCSPPLSSPPLSTTQSNARYVLSVARKLGATLFLGSYTDLLHPKPKSSLVLLASLMVVDFRIRGELAGRRE
jgi:hypothetical protein